MAQDSEQVPWVDPDLRITDSAGLVLAKHAYMRQMDVMWQWPNSLNPWHAGAVNSFLSNTALFDKGHPLHPGQDGLTLYLGYDKTNRPRLLFTLKQVEYIQYCINALRLSNPSWVEYYSKRAELEQDGSEKAMQELEELEEPSYELGQDDWVPIPDMVLPAEWFIKVEEITIPSFFHLTKVTKQLDKDAKIAERHERNGLPLPDFDPKRFEPILALDVPPTTEEEEIKKKEQRAVQKEQEKQARRERMERDRLAKQGTPAGDATPEAPPSAPEEAKAGANSKAKAGDVKPNEDDSQNPAWIKAAEEAATKVLQDFGFASNTKSDDGSDDGASRDDSLDSGDEGEDDEPQKTLTDDQLAERYHFVASQALIIAAEGGLRNALAEVEAEVTPENEPPKEVGRSSFLALAVTRWDQDSKVVLEVGWSAMYWQEVIQPGSQRDGNAKPVFEEIRDQGHYIVEDHRLNKKNTTYPDYRENYLFGESLQVPKAKLKSTIRNKIVEVNTKGGKGSLYVLVHARKGVDFDFKDIGPSFSTERGDFGDLRPDTGGLPPYMDATKCGVPFMINTAALFGGIERATPTRPPAGYTPVINSTSIDESITPIDDIKGLGRTEKSLQHVAMLLFGDYESRKPQFCGNAGNDAFYTLQVFVALMTGNTLDKFREAYEANPVQPDFFSSMHDPTAAEEPLEFIIPGPTRDQVRDSEKWENDEVEGQSIEEWIANQEKGLQVIMDPNHVEEEEMRGVSFFCEDDEGNEVAVGWEDE
ncbi:hypothetical protein L202_06492 [Cryptococcus amylolentus CBS 6039]|uniref:Gfd2/YDR514C-like C-terminal domain-containing protein n=1 Tax=Cryptococcus amylolentus CBS 6039 TaxID=1295533 RepID=A0A1E3HIS3_9TREE|nr:hypothetical protein L202_06492 [Cryptococcus amylolentus CBS 6039]ODN75311.1 hypothetical protein L202_06492 [Cryptococcus amylolentus CBS 6039]